MNMLPLDVCFPSVGLDIAAKIEAKERELERRLQIYVKFEEGWNERFKAMATGGGVELARLQAERTAYETSLGIEAIIDHAGRLREGRTELSDLVGMAMAGALREDIAVHVVRFFGGGHEEAGPLSLEAWWLAGSLLDWVSQPLHGSETDMTIRVIWRDLERLAADKGQRTP